jgi:hypothetical protein
MNDNILISRTELAREAKMKIAKGNLGSVELVGMHTPVIGNKIASMSQADKFKAIDGLTRMDFHGSLDRAVITGKYASGFDVPQEWSDGSSMSARDKLYDKFFMSSNTLPSDWNNLWDAFRIDVTVRKAAMPTIREYFYNIINNPGFTRTVNPTEINPFATVFEENNGHGQAIPQGETLGGGYESFTILIYAAGFTWDLMSELFDLTITPERVMDSVMVGYNSLKDDLAISPIIEYVYSGVQQTPAATLSGANRQELLYLTLEDALDDLGDRDHPVTGNELDVSTVRILAHPYDARHIARVASGLPSTNERVYPALSEIDRVVAYDGEVIKLRDRSVTYTGVTKGKAYMVIPASAAPVDGYMEIAVKRDLQIETDLTPDVKTLARQETAYWFAEGIWYEGIQYFVQEITLPTW